ncbi:MAG: glycosyl transferase family 90 [Pseudomonadota bacterium]
MRFDDAAEIDGDTRLRVALGALSGAERTIYAVSGHEGVVCHRHTTLETYLETLYATGWRRGQHRDKTTLTAVFQRYILPLVRLFDRFCIDSPFLAIDTDNRVPALAPALCKSRSVGAPGLCVLHDLDRHRHFGLVADVAAADRPFAEKSDTLVWRGATTGVFDPDRGPLSPRAFIPALADRGRADIDVGFHTFTRRVLRDAGADGAAALERHHRPEMDLSQQLHHRYLLSLEGHDVASGLKWMMASNSVVLMPPVTAESWACETRLAPYRHFVPVRADLADVPDQLSWCRREREACQAIVAAANQFVADLMHPPTNHKVGKAIVEHYAATVALTRAPGCRIPESVLPA